MLSDQERVSVISEALPYIRKFRGETFVIKYGGASMTNARLKQKVIEDIALLHYVGVRPVLVHGGGPEINQMLGKLNIPAQFKDGMRVTDKQTMEIVEMVLAGKIQKELVGLLNAAGTKAIGLTGRDAGLLKAKKLNTENFDWGFTGEIESISPEILELLTKENYIPIISSIAWGEDGEAYNINADLMAAEIAISLKAKKLILLTDTPGILNDKNDKSTLINKMNIPEMKKLIDAGIIAGGMIPKTLSAIDSLERGVGSVHILDGTFEHVILLETFTQAGVGTMLSSE